MVNNAAIFIWKNPMLFEGFLPHHLLSVYIFEMAEKNLTNTNIDHIQRIETEAQKKVLFLRFWYGHVQKIQTKYKT